MARCPAVLSCSLRPPKCRRSVQIPANTCSCALVSRASGSGLTTICQFCAANEQPAGTADFRPGSPCFQILPLQTFWKLVEVLRATSGRFAGGGRYGTGQRSFSGAHYMNRKRRKSCGFLAGTLFDAPCLSSCMYQSGSYLED